VEVRKYCMVQQKLGFYHFNIAINPYRYIDFGFNMAINPYLKKTGFQLTLVHFHGRVEVRKYWSSKHVGFNIAINPYLKMLTAWIRGIRISAIKNTEKNNNKQMKQNINTSYTPHANYNFHLYLLHIKIGTAGCTHFFPHNNCIWTNKYQ
jgi:hypothetical protein